TGRGASRHSARGARSWSSLRHPLKHARRIGAGVTRRLAVGVVMLVLVGVAVLVVVSRMDTAAIADAFAQTAWKWVSIAAAVNLLSVGVDAARWKSILGAVRRVSIVSAVEALLVGWLSNLIVPLKLGEGAKAWVMARREGLPMSTVVSTVLL